MGLQIVFDAEQCTGCMACILSCSVKKSGLYSYHLAYLQMRREEAIALSDLRFCGNCGEHACQAACPAEAITFSCAYQIPLLDQEACVQCGACLDACPFGLVKETADGAIRKCDFCSGDPACVKACIPGALRLREIQTEGGE